MIAIWILSRGLIKDSPSFHHHLQMRDQVHDVVIGEESGIHLVELVKWKKQRVEGELDRWTYFFQQGEELDDESLPEGLDTKEMRQAMETLKMFSEQERANHAYQARMNFLREQNTILGEREEARQQAEAERQRAEAERQRAEAEQQRAEAEQQRAEVAEELLKAERQQAEVARRTNERLRKLLIEAGLDPGEE